MAITANAWVDKNGRAVITLWSSTGWVSPEWSIQGGVGQLPDPDYTSLYGYFNRSGEGLISQDFLIVTVEACPKGDFTLYTEKGGKIFNLLEGRFSFSASLVGVNQLNPPVSTEASDIFVDDLAKGFIYFGSSLEPFKGRFSAQLQVDGKLHAVVGGNAVDLVDNEFNTGYWAIPAAIFTDFYWHTPPTGPTDYDFVVKEERRGGRGEMKSIPVRMDLTQIYSPLPDSLFPVEPTNIFRISLTTGFLVFT